MLLYPPLLNKTRVRPVVLDKWFPLSGITGKANEDVGAPRTRRESVRTPIPSATSSLRHEFKGN